MVLQGQKNEDLVLIQCLNGYPNDGTHTDNTNYADKEKRHHKRMHKTEESDNDNSNSTICRCNTYGRTFADRP